MIRDLRRFENHDQITNRESRITNPTGSPPDTDLRIVPQHEPVSARLDRFAVDSHVFADQAVDHAVRQIAKARALQDDAVLDLGIANLDVVHDRRERPHIRVHDARSASDDRRPAHHRAFDRCADLDHHLAFDPALSVDDPLDTALQCIEDQPVRLQHVLQLARVLPPAVDDLGPDREAPIDEILNGVGDLELVAEARPDALHRLEHLWSEHVDTDQREITYRFGRLLDEPHHLAV